MALLYVVPMSILFVFDSLTVFDSAYGIVSFLKVCGKDLLILNIL